MVLAAEEGRGVVLRQLVHSRHVVGVVLRVLGNLLGDRRVAGQLLHNVLDGRHVVGAGSRANPGAAPVVSLRALADRVVAISAVADFFLAAVGDGSFQRVAQQVSTCSSDYTVALP